ncbi:MAG: phage holin family protein [Ferruginibacter sp.]
MQENIKIEELTTNLKRYANTSYELIKLEATEKTSVMGAGLISGILVAYAGLLFVLFLSLGLSFYLSHLVGNSYAGFLIVGGFFLLLALILFMGRKKLVDKPIRNLIIRKIFSEN